MPLLCPLCMGQLLLRLDRALSNYTNPTVTIVGLQFCMHVTVGTEDLHDLDCTMCSDEHKHVR